MCEWVVGGKGRRSGRPFEDSTGAVSDSMSGIFEYVCQKEVERRMFPSVGTFFAPIR